MKNLFTCLIAVLLSGAAYSQYASFVIPQNVALPRDTVLKNQLLANLNAFLLQVPKPNNENALVLPDALLQTSLLLDEFKGLTKSIKYNDTNFYKCTLTNATPLTDSTFLIQLAYMGAAENKPLLRAAFTIMAQKQGNAFSFYAPLQQNTSNWKQQQFGATTVYFKIAINQEAAKNYFAYIAAFDKKLGVQQAPTKLYVCDNYHEVLQITGVDYKSDYNGHTLGTLNAVENKEELIVNGSLTPQFKNFDPHDMWHSRLHRVLSTAIINKPVDEGTAYLYGGSWGLSWEQILSKFKAFAAANPTANWLALYNESKNFDEKASYPLNVDMVINALIVKKLQHDKGFDAVKQLLSCGVYQKDNANYFKALNTIAGISMENFNTAVWALIKAN